MKTDFEICSDIKRNAYTTQAIYYMLKVRKYDEEKVDKIIAEMRELIHD